MTRARDLSNSGHSIGPTSSRPASPFIGQDYYDTTIGAMMLYQASGWQVYSTGQQAPYNVVATNTYAGASIAFSASPGATSYTVTSSTGKTATGSSSPLVISGLTVGSSYTFTVTATGPFGNSGSSVPSNSLTYNPLASVSSASFTNWYDFSNNAYLTLSGSNVTAATDLSGSSRVLTVSGTIPLLSAQINGLSAASIAGGNYFSIANPITYSSTNAHWFVVVQPKSGAPTHDNGLIGGTGDPGILAYTLPGASGSGFTQSWLNTSRYWFSSGSYSGYTTSRAYQINASYIPSTGAYVYRQSRTADGSGTQALGSGYSSPTNAIGYQESGYPGSSIIGEIIMFNNPLSTNDLTTVENYIYAKWGV